MLGVRLEPELEQRLSALAKKVIAQKAIWPKKRCAVKSTS